MGPVGPEVLAEIDTDALAESEVTNQAGALASLDKDGKEKDASQTKSKTICSSAIFRMGIKK